MSRPSTICVSKINPTPGRKILLSSQNMAGIGRIVPNLVHIQSTQLGTQIMLQIGLYGQYTRVKAILEFSTQLGTLFQYLIWYTFFVPN